MLRGCRLWNVESITTLYDCSERQTPIILMTIEEGDGEIDREN